MCSEQKEGDRMPPKKKTASGSDDKSKKPYLQTKEKDEVIAYVALINKQMNNGDEWIKKNCTAFKGNNHLTAFVLWLQREYHRDRECRAKCNKRDITAVQVRNWIQAVRTKIKKVNDEFRDLPGWEEIPQLEYLKDGALSPEEKAAKEAERKLQRLKADAAFLRDLMRG
jgi:hypothetical protein